MSDSAQLRRAFLWTSGLAGGGLLLSATAAAQRGQPAAANKEQEEEVSPPEDLMREHGILKRVLLVYEEAIRRIEAKQELPPEPVRRAAQIIRAFIEDYHEKLEEDFLFPRFEKARRLTDILLSGPGASGSRQMPNGQRQNRVDGIASC
jgi:hypothetical protein